MVKMKESKIKHYICEICGKVFKTEENANKCEAKGVAVQWWDTQFSTEEYHIWDELEIGDIIMGSCGGCGIDQVVVVGLIPKGHQLWLMIVSKDDPNPREVKPERLDGSYIMDDDEINNMKWLFERSEQTKEKIKNGE